jgi:hypothetical protein
LQKTIALFKYPFGKGGTSGAFPGELSPFLVQHAVLIHLRPWSRDRNWKLKCQVIISTSDRPGSERNSVPASSIIAFNFFCRHDCSQSGSDRTDDIIYLLGVCPPSTAGSTTSRFHSRVDRVPLQLSRIRVVIGCYLRSMNWQAKWPKCKQWLLEDNRWHRYFLGVANHYLECHSSIKDFAWRKRNQCNGGECCQTTWKMMQPDIFWNIG